jgi:hypothetical protein
MGGYLENRVEPFLCWPMTTETSHQLYVIGKLETLRTRKQHTYPFFLLQPDGRLSTAANLASISSLEIAGMTTLSDLLGEM